MGVPVGDGAVGAFWGGKLVAAGPLSSDRVAEVSLGTGAAGVFLGDKGVISGTTGGTLGGRVTKSSLEAVESMVFWRKRGISAGTVGASLRNEVAGAFWGDTEVSVGATGAPLEDGGMGEGLAPGRKEGSGVERGDNRPAGETPGRAELFLGEGPFVRGETSVSKDGKLAG